MGPRSICTAGRGGQAGRQTSVAEQRPTREPASQRTGTPRFGGGKPKRKRLRKPFRQSVATDTAAKILRLCNRAGDSVPTSTRELFPQFQGSRSPTKAS